MANKASALSKDTPIRRRRGAEKAAADPKSTKAKGKAAATDDKAKVATASTTEETNVGTKIPAPTTVSDEVYLRHMRRLKNEKAALAKVMEEAASVRATIRDVKAKAKEAGCDVKEIEWTLDAMQRPKGEIVQQHRLRVHLLKINGVVFGQQLDLFAGSDPNVDPELQGEHAGGNGEPRANNPFKIGTKEYADWTVGWTRAQERIAGEMGAGVGDDDDDSEDVKAAREAGRKYGLAGKPLVDNPHAGKSDKLSVAWKEGWKDGQNDRVAKADANGAGATAH